MCTYKSKRSLRFDSAPHVELIFLLKQIKLPLIFKQIEQMLIVKREEQDLDLQESESIADLDLQVEGADLDLKQILIFIQREVILLLKYKHCPRSSSR